MYTPNSFGILFFAVWPLIIYWLYKKLTPKQTIFLAISLATLILPSAYTVDYPLLPPLDRDSLTSLALLVVLAIKKQKYTVFKSGAWNKFLIGYLFAIVASTLANMDAIEPGGVSIRGTELYDIISDVILFMLFLVPFFLGRSFFNNPLDTEYMYKTLTILALVYGVLMLYELKFGPHLHETAYGYFPGNFIQQLRGDGFRPVVFVWHGLKLAFWFVIATIAALALFKNKVDVLKLPSLKVIPGLKLLSGLKLIIFLVIVLLLCKTVSATMYLLIAAILMFFFKLKRQLFFSFIMAIMVMIYPVNTTTQYVKYSDILNFVSSYDGERSASLKTRFDNEERLAARAMQRPLFGWAGWGRSHVYENGQDITVLDGMWIIVLGKQGIVGFIFYYLLLIYPLYLARKYYRYIDNSTHQVYFVTLAIILAIGILDSIPNTGMMPVHFLLAGALLGQAEYVKKSISNKKLKEETF